MSPAPRLRAWSRVLLASTLVALSTAAAERPRRDVVPAQEAPVVFDIPPMPLDQALLEYARQSGRMVAATGPLRRAPSSGRLNGAMTPDAALRRLLQGSGFDFTIREGIVRVAPSRVRTRRAEAAAPAPTLPTATDLAGISVTARRRRELQVDVPVSVSVLRGEQIEAHGLASASDALRLLPGVTTVDGGDALTQVQIRGVSSSLGGNDNGYYLDEVPFTGVTVPWHPDTRAFDMDRIEVLKGPQGALFGEGSMGGTVRLLTRAPEIDHVAARLETGVQRTTGGGSGQLARVMGNLPLVPGQLALRVVATRESPPAWIRNGNADTPPSNDSDLATRRLRLRWLSGSWTTDLSHVRSSHDSPGGGYGADDGGMRDAVMASRSHWRSTSLVGQGDLGATRLTLLAAKARMGNVASGRFAPDVAVATDVGIDVDTYEARWSGSTGPSAWLLGYMHRTSERIDDLEVDVLQAQARQRNRANALFGEISMDSPDRRWSWSGGLRYFLDRVDADSATSGVGNRLSSTFARFNPRLSLSRHLSPRRKLHASVATGFRSGQLQPAYSLRTAQALDIPLPERIAGDTLLSWELAYTHASDDGTRLLQAALFHSRWSDLPVRMPLDGIYNGLVNSPGADIDGLELGWSLAPADDLRLDFGATVVNARYRAAIPGSAIVAGTPVYNVPRTSLFAAASRRWPLGGAWHASASARATYHSRRHTGLVQGHQGDAIGDIGARLGLQSVRGWEAYLTIDNALDARGAVDGRGTNGSANRLRPRTLGIEVHVAY